MQSGRQYIFFRFFLVVVFVASVGSQSAVAEAEARTSQGIFFNLISPSAKLVDQTGKAFSPVKEKSVWLVHFIFTHCSNVCSRQTQQLAQLADALPVDTAKHLHIVAFSVDPLNDTPEILKRYAERFPTKSVRRSFVTGSPAAMQAVFNYFGTFGPEKLAANNPVDIDSANASKGGIPFNPAEHRSSIYLLNAQGQILQSYRDPLDVQRIANEISALISMQFSS